MLTRSASHILRGYLGHGLGSDRSSSKLPDPLEEPGLDNGGLVGSGSPVEVGRDGPLPFGPLMPVHFGTPPFDGLVVWADDNPNGLGPGPGSCSCLWKRVGQRCAWALVA